MAEVKTDDEIHGYFGRWFGAQGTEWPAHITYFAWATWLTLIFPLWVFVMILTTASPINCFLLATALDILITGLVRKWVQGDRTLGGLLQLLRSDARTFLAARKAAVAAERAGRPIALITRHVTIRARER